MPTAGWFASRWQPRGSGTRPGGFLSVDRPWRGFGVIPGGGLDLAVTSYNHLDARRRFGIDLQAAEEDGPGGVSGGLPD